jgi:hypothetical protein
MAQAVGSPAEVFSFHYHLAVVFQVGSGGQSLYRQQGFGQGGAVAHSIYPIYIILKITIQLNDRKIII